MTELNALVSQLGTLGFNDPVVEHAAVETIDEWAAALAGATGVPEKHQLTKTLIFKPKQPKSEPIAPVMVVAKSDSATNAKVIGTQLKLKELRFANDDVLTNIFSTQKGSVSPFALANVPQENIGSVRLVVDKALLDADTGLIALHPLQSTQTIFITADTLQAFIKSIGGLTGVTEMDFSAEAAASAQEKKAAAAPSTASKAPVKKKTETAEGSGRLGLEVKKEVDFSLWYQRVLTRSDMLSYYDVSGCYIIRPSAYFIWEQVQQFFDAGIRALGVKNCYFPMFVSGKALEREKDHIEGFAPEVAWVTKAGSSDLQEPVAIRPTSETVIYPYFAKWIRSHRDLPLKINQWCSVVRWEFKNPQPFLRTREFLWQEGHTAHLTKDEAMTEVRDILTLYRRIYEELLAVPVVEGVKSENEKFAGGDATTTVEGFIPEAGRGIQGGTSHYLGQNFSKMFNVIVEDPKASGDDKPKIHVHQNSWGFSTRSIGVMVMLHSDNDGLVLPPRVAETQVIIIPCGIAANASAEDRTRITDACLNVEARLKHAGIRVETDLREGYTTGFKFNHWKLRGVPLRLEIGPKDLQKNTVLGVRRYNGAEEPISLDSLESSVQLLMVNIQDEMLARARATMDSRIKTVYKWEDFVPTLNNKCLVLTPWCERSDCEDQIKDRSARDVQGDEPEDEKAPSMGAKSLCLPFKQPQENPIVPGTTKCVQCGQDAKRYALFGRSY
ncbi:hypothetical protein EV175_002435 [Coemansia sp. RSA 1933]|nr:hypothetical protein EV175_002435 [Coemansia sp. RSA 1933]